MGTVDPATMSVASGHDRTVLGGRYALVRHIAVGGMGEVWAATDTVLGRDVAVKILRSELVDTPVFLRRFRAEARHTAALTHPGIALVFDYGEETRDARHVAYLVMELVDGEPLSLVIAKRGRMPAQMVVPLLAQVADALHAAHAMGVVHRDVKPGNLILRDDGTIKVTDFGIARAANSVPMTEVGQIIGTARYMSPEQASGGSATPASDIYSLGVVGYEMLCGHPPFTADNAAALALAHVHRTPDPLPSDVPAGVQTVIARALAKDPARRPRDARAFATELRRVLATAVPVVTAPAVAGPVDPPTVLASKPGVEAPTTAVAPRSPTSVMPTAREVRRPTVTARRARRLRRSLPLVPLAALAGVVALMASVPGHDARDIGSTTTTATDATPTTAAPVSVDAAALVGHPAAEVSRMLANEGLTVRLRTVDAPGVAPGVVTGVEPTGIVPTGASVTIDVSGGATLTTASTAASEPHHGNGKGRGRGKG